MLTKEKTTVIESLKIVENDPQNGMITCQLRGLYSAGGLRIINGYLDCQPGEVWAIEYDAEAIGDDPHGLLWLVDARIEQAAKAPVIVVTQRSKKRTVKPAFAAQQLELFAA